VHWLGFVWFLLVITLVSVGHFFLQPILTWTLPLVARTLGPLWFRFDPVFRFEPWLFEPIAERDLPQDQQTYFALHTPALLKMGFAPLGDYVLRRDPAPSCSRYFLSPCGTEIGMLTSYLGEKCICCASIALDGTYFETGNTSVDQPPPPQHGLAFFTIASGSPQAVVEHHRRCATLAARSRQTELALIEPSDVATVLNYGRSLSLNSLHQQGVLPTLPEFLREQRSAKT
jgi:hypothetical protein